jgi:hypothetical protein
MTPFVRSRAGDHWLTQVEDKRAAIIRTGLGVNFIVKADSRAVMRQGPLAIVATEDGLRMFAGASRTPIGGHDGA